MNGNISIWEGEALPQSNATEAAHLYGAIATTGWLQVREAPLVQWIGNRDAGFCSTVKCTLEETGEAAESQNAQSYYSIKKQCKKIYINIKPLACLHLDTKSLQ